MCRRAASVSIPIGANTHRPPLNLTASILRGIRHKPCSKTSVEGELSAASDWPPASSTEVSFTFSFRLYPSSAHHSNSTLVASRYAPAPPDSPLLVVGAAVPIRTSVARQIGVCPRCQVALVARLLCASTLVLVKEWRTDGDVTASRSTPLCLERGAPGDADRLVQTRAHQERSLPPLAATVDAPAQSEAQVSRC